ncbi:MAG: Fur family transcriptional regulator [Acidimicrobiales bacterium]
MQTGLLSKTSSLIIFLTQYIICAEVHFVDESNEPDFARQLRDHGLQVTAQRIGVMEALASHPHATTEEVADAVRGKLGAISRQAVYDTLGTFVEKQLVRRIQPSGSAARYEDRVGDNHHHLVCRGCGVMFDIDCAVGDTPCLTADDDHGFEIDEAEVVYWGRCPTCRIG